MLHIMFFVCIIGSQTLIHMPSTIEALPLSSETDKLALLALKEKLTNGDPNSLPSWNESLHFCQWHGVTCSPHHKRVSILQLENENWGGTLGPSLGNLTFLKVLNLTSIYLRGEIPREVGHLRRLQILDLRRNNLHGDIPMELSNCSSLEVIELAFNNLTGEVPSWLGSMMQLGKLMLGANNLVGNIPPSLGNLSSLEALYLAGNHLEGSIPHALGKLLNLEWLSLAANNLSSTVPNSLYNLSNIQLLDLGNNQLKGTILSNLHLAFPNLMYLDIGVNHFTGTFPSSISNLSQLQSFDITNNSLSGQIPPTLGSLNQLQIFLTGGNNLGSGNGHDLDFLSSLTNCTQLKELEVISNNLGGVLPRSIGNLSTNLYAFSVVHNQIFGTIPEEIGNLHGLTALYLGWNFIEGTIPNSIGKLTNLVRLYLSHNKLSGNIPTFIGNLTMLSEVYLWHNKLEGTIPFSLRYCTKMQMFEVSDNNLSGNIPNQIFGFMEGLVNIDLAMNSFTGPLPSDFGKLKHLSTLYVHANKLSGEIPMELSACSALTKFVLERNSFHGSIPSFLGSLKSLEILDLSNNNFSGTIPHELENLTLLNSLNLSYNHLNGEVPKGGVFSNITAISIIGNKDLCGGIPQLSLPPCPKSPLEKHKRSIKNKLIIIVFGGIFISFIAFISIHYLRKKPKMSSSSLSPEHRYVKVSYGELHQATNGFSSSNLIGRGGSGSVYKGTLVHFERPVAVKVLNLQTRGASKSFMAECNALGKIKHRNLLNILTCCSGVDYKGEDFKAIVFEYMPNGSLESLLHNNEDNEPRNLNLNLKERVDIALDVANALDYLHNDSEEAIVHCDIKPSNVLLDDEMVAHLGDFGLARLLHGATTHSSTEQASSSIVKGTIGYIPPEYGAGVQVSPQGDIYSYGILLLEMLTGKKPTDSMFSEGLSLHKFCNMASTPEGITEIVDPRLLIALDAEQRRVIQQQNTEDIIGECLVSIARIGVACSAEFPAQRMGIKEAIKELHATKQKLPQ